MVKKDRVRIQSLVFSKRFFPNRFSVRKWIEHNDFIIDKRLIKPILNNGGEYRVRQKNPDWFYKKTFKPRSLGKGVKGIYGKLRR